MKTLDEVIKKFEMCSSQITCSTCPYSQEICSCDPDALHYLKEYRETKKHLACLDDAEIRGDDTQVVNNPAITWGELQQMEGKPVWVEWTGEPCWGFVDEILSKDFSGAEIIFFDTPYNYLHFERELLGKTWQAYRKER